MSTKTIHQPTDLRAGDTATIEGAQFKIEALVTEAYFDTESGVVSIRLAVGRSMNVNVGPGCDAKFVSATREVAEFEPGTVAVVIQGGDPGAGVDDHEFRAALQTDGTWVGLAGEAATAAPVSVRPLVVIDPERARDLVKDHFNDDRSRALLDALLAGESR